MRKNNSPEMMQIFEKKCSTITANFQKNNFREFMKICEKIIFNISKFSK